MEPSTFRRALICVCFVTPHLTLGQNVTLNMKSKETHHANDIRVELLLNARSDSAPAGLQWEFNVPAQMQIVKIEEGKATKEAGKMLVCNGAKCLIYGWNRTTIPNGQIAIANFKFDQRVAAAKDSTNFGHQDHDGRRARKQEIQLRNLVGTSLEGKTILVASGTRSE